MSIPFTQFLMPFGQPKSTSIDRSPEVEAKATALIAEGYKFESEVLSTGECSFTCGRGEDEMLAIEVCPNGPCVLDAVDRLVEESFDAMKARTAK